MPNANLGLFNELIKDQNQLKLADNRKKVSQKSQTGPWLSDPIRWRSI